ncbi:MAG: eukaryotic-like serine/threonine-protein kinase, partial [Nocardioidaceae bacterium]|nr:eukaryotic-like serine/threonine-protein kinase [Nocardioidaceae bacterium]
MGGGPDLGAGAARVQLCGPLVVDIGGQRLEDELPRRQGRLLFAYLALNRGRWVTRSELIDALWPHNPPPRVDAAFRSLLSRTRGALGPALHSTRGELRLELPDGAWVDVEVAHDALAEAQAAAREGDWDAVEAPATCAIEVAERILLPGTDADWIEVARRDLEDVRLAALEALARSALQRSQPNLAAVEKAGRAIITASPFRETGYVFLIETLERRGNVAEAMRVYDQVRQLLRDELGAAPCDELQALHGRLLSRSSEPDELEPELAAGAELGRVHLPLPVLLSSPERGDLIGRANALEQLRACWTRAQEGNPEVVFVAGEPGIGKSRLCAEFSRHIHAEGANVLHGRCSEESLSPFQPFLECLSHLISQVPGTELAALLGPGASELARLVPDLRARLPQLPEPASGDSEGERYRLFEAVSTVLVSVSRARPMVVVLEDLHWADRPTLLLFKHLARFSRSSAALVIATYRDTETGHALTEMLADLRRDGNSQRVELTGLDRGAVATLIGAFSGHSPASRFVGALHEETSGNPFFVLEILRHAVERHETSGESATRADLEIEDIGVPEGIKDVIGRRLARLNDDTQAVLAIAAVIGREFTLDVIEKVSDLPAEEVLDAVEEAVIARVITEVPRSVDRYTFSHALIRETLYDQLLNSRRVRLHRRIGEVLEERPGGVGQADVAALAHHSIEAARDSDLDRAIEYSVRAGTGAEALLAYEEAAGHYQAAAHALYLKQPAETDEHFAVLRALGEALFKAGDLPRGRNAFEQAADIARLLEEPELLGHAALGFGGRFVWGEAGVVDRRLVGLLEEALAALPDEDSPLRALLLGRLATELQYQPRAKEQRASAGKHAVAMARRIGDPAVLGDALSAQHLTLMDPAATELRLSIADEIVSLGAHTGDPELRWQGHYWRLVDLLELGEIGAADVEIDVCGQIAEQLRVPLYLWETASFRAIRALLDGRFDQAEELIGHARTVAGQAQDLNNVDQVFYAQMFLLRTEQGRLQELEEMV